jgi:hypothetical protein
MELVVFYDNKNHIVVAVPKGSVTSENVKATAEKALEFSKQHDCKFFLFDIRSCREAQPLIEGYHTMQDMRKTTGLEMHHKCAILYDPSTYSEQRAQFIEDVVANRPNPHLKVFKTLEAVHEWIKELKSEN